MSLFDTLDATRICARWSEPLADPSVWARPAPVAPRSDAMPPRSDYSWFALLRNPHAALVTGMVGTMVVRDTLTRMLTTT